MTEVLNLQALRTIVGSFDGELYYAKGHTSAGDGGGGIFMWRTGEQFKTTNIPPIVSPGIYSVDNYGTIIQAVISGTPNDTGRWIRQYDGYINVLYFGAFGFGAPSGYNIEIQNAINFAALNAKINPTLKGSTVFIPNGSYILTNIILKTGVSILGESLNATNIYSPNGTSTQYLFEIENGPVTLNISNLNIIGNDTEKGCFLFRAQNSTTSPFHGGLWNSRISNISISNFKGHGIYLYGGGNSSNYLLPNQFNIFENVRVFKNSDFSYALFMTGQNGQITFMNCEFDGFYKNGTYSKGQNIRIQNEKEFTSAVVSFINCTCQDADYGILIEYAENIKIDNCWFENLGVAITVTSNLIDPGKDVLSKSINIANNRFANASGFGSLNAPNNIKAGQCVSVNKSIVNVFNSYVTVSDPEGPYFNANSYFLLATNNVTGGINILNNNFQTAKLGKTFGVMQVISVISNAIDCYSNKEVFVNVSASPITTIKSAINAGELLNIRAHGGPIIFKNTNNIYFLTTNPSSSLTLNNGEVVTFIKVDNVIGSNYENYQLISIVKTLS